MKNPYRSASRTIGATLIALALVPLLTNHIFGLIGFPLGTPIVVVCLLMVLAFHLIGQNCPRCGISALRRKPLFGRACARCGLDLDHEYSDEEIHNMQKDRDQATKAEGLALPVLVLALFAAALMVAYLAGRDGAPPDTMQETPPSATVEEGVGRIFIASIPPVAEVYCEGELVGKTNLQELQFRTGTNRVTFVKDSVSYDTTLSIAEGKNPSAMVVMRTTSPSRMPANRKSEPL